MPLAAPRPVRVLFLCTHNSARSQLAEAILRQRGGAQYEVFSAGSDPTSVHPLAAALLEQYGIDARTHHSKSIDEFLGRSFDYVITLCDRVRDHCPHFPADPVQIHWSFPDPAAEQEEAARERAFATLWLELNTRIALLLNLPHPETGQRTRPESLVGRH